MNIENVRIDRYGPLGPREQTFDTGFTVVYGPNESGKTLLLEAILRLMHSDIDLVMDGVTRVDTEPVGAVTMNLSDGQVRLDQNVSLGEPTDVTARQLRNVYVVRDSDIRLDDEHAFYDDVTQRIGDLHTTEIAEIKERLIKRGRLTPTTRSLSGAADKDGAAAVREAAVSLREDMDSYVRRAEDNEVAAREREAIAIAAQRERSREALETQREAHDRKRLNTLWTRLETVERTTAYLEEAGDRETLEDLQERRDRIQRTKRDIENTEEVLERKRSRAENLTDTHRELDATETALADQREQAEQVRESLQRYRNLGGDPSEVTILDRTSAGVAVAGVGTGGGVSLIGNVLAGMLLIVIGLMGLAVVLYRHYRRRQVAAAASAVLQAARDAGLDVEVVDGVATAIRNRIDEHERVREEFEETRREREVCKRRVSDLEDDLEELRTRLSTDQRELEQHLSTLDVPDVATYAEQVDQAEQLHLERKAAMQSLSDRLGEPDQEDPSTQERLSFWRARLNEREETLPDDADPTVYDPEALERLTEEVERLDRRYEDLHETLEEHERTLDDFADRLDELETHPFLNASITLEAQTTDGLRRAIDDLSRLIERIDRRADVAREALDLFDTIEADEERKIRDLFGPGSRATEAFQRFTNGRYDEVTYDASERTLRVHPTSGDPLTPEQLSHATRDQLYLAARVGLAHQLHGASPGFFLLDDPLLPADPDRLQTSVDVLMDLAAEGWQILYFTAKAEIGEDIVTDRDLSCIELERL